jgi:hypothetical protein
VTGHSRRYAWQVNQPARGQAWADHDAGIPRPARAARHRGLVITLAAFGGVCCLVAAVLAGGAAIAQQTRRPTAAERAAAAATAVARRWRTWPAGRIFPATLGYTTKLLNDDTARRVGISPDDQCAAALDPAVAGPARRDGCRAGLRASYVDELQGVVYTTGVLAFPSPGKARAFDRGLRTARPRAAALRALAFPGTAAARFADDARETAIARQDGPYVLLTVAGYADGRPAAAAGHNNPLTFDAAGSLAKAILTPLNRPAVVNCAATRQWSC